MTGIDRLSGSSSLGGLADSGIVDARLATTGAIGEIGHRVLAWVADSAKAGDAGSAAWSRATGSESIFKPDSSELARGGDVYDLRGLSADIAGRLGATPAQEGELHRSLEEFTRAAVVQLAGLSGASGDRQIAGVRDALATAANSGGEGIDGVVSRLEAATARLNSEMR